MESKAIISVGRYVIMLGGRHAGKKALVVASYPNGTEDRKFPYCVVLGLEKGPKKITREMPQEVIVKRTQMKTFVKAINYNHVLLTRHVLKDDDLLQKIKPDTLINSMKDKALKKEALTQATNVLRQKYLNNKMTWLFKQFQF